MGPVGLPGAPGELGKCTTIINGLGTKGSKGDKGIRVSTFNVVTYVCIDTHSYASMYLISG